MLPGPTLPYSEGLARFLAPHKTHQSQMSGSFRMWNSMSVAKVFEENKQGKKFGRAEPESERENKGEGSSIFSSSRTGCVVGLACIDQGGDASYGEELLETFGGSKTATTRCSSMLKLFRLIKAIHITASSGGLSSESHIRSLDFCGVAKVAVESHHSKLPP